MKSYHYASLKTSKHHQDILQFILNHPMCSNRDLVNGTSTIRPSSDISDINHSFQDMELGLRIQAVDCGRTENNKRLTRWALMSDFLPKAHVRELLKEWQENKEISCER